MDASRNDSQIDTAAAMAKTGAPTASGRVAGTFSHLTAKAADKVPKVNKKGGDRFRDTADKASHLADEAAAKAVYAFNDIERKARRGAEEIATLGGLVELLSVLALTRAYEWIRRLVVGADRVAKVDRGPHPNNGSNLAYP